MITTKLVSSKHQLDDYDNDHNLSECQWQDRLSFQYIGAMTAVKKTEHDKWFMI